MRRHRRRALSYTFVRRCLALSSVLAMAITVRDLASTVATGSTAATLTGAGTIITGTNQDLCRGAVSAATQVKANAGVLNGSPAQILF